jgi:hypothetical protein
MTYNEQLMRKALMRITKLGSDDAPTNWILVVRAMEIARKALADSPVKSITRRPPHWTCKTHGDFNAMREVGCPECTRLLRQALLRAFDQHGHPYNCSAARGMESECICGWLEVRQLVEQMKEIP